MNFRNVCLSDIFQILGGGTPKTSVPEYWNGNIPWLSVKDFNSDDKWVVTAEKTITEKGLRNSSTQILHPGDLIISARGTVGELAMIGRSMAFNQSCYGLRAKDGYDRDFSYYCLLNAVKRIKANTHGSVFDTITRDTFNQISVDVPEQEIQIKIGKTLSLLDEKIRINKLINKNLDNQCRLSFKKTLETTVLKQVEIGQLDIFVTDYVANGSFAALKANVNFDPNNKYAHFLRNTDLKSGYYNTFVDKHSYEFLSKTKLYGGEVIISNVGDVGSVYLTPYLTKPMTLGNNMIAIKSDDRNLLLYLYYYFLSSTGQATIKGITGGSAQPKFNKTDFKNCLIYLPDRETIENFGKNVNYLLGLQNSLKSQNLTLEKLRNSLIPKLLSGEIEIK